MDLELSDEQRAIRDVVREFAAQRVLPRAAEIDESGEFFWDLLHEAGDLGIIGLSLPKDVGGAGADPIAVALATEEIARCSAVVASVITGVRMQLMLLNSFGSAEQKSKWMPGLLSGEIVPGFGVTEPEAGSDVSSIRTRAIRHGDGYTINGAKCFTSLGSICSVFFLLAYTDPAKRTRGGMTMFLVDAKSPGITIGAEEKKLGQKGAPLTSEYFEDVQVGTSDVLGQEGEGFKIIMHGLDAGRIEVAASAVGLSEACFDTARKYAGERVQFGQPIASFQMIQAMLADMATEIEAGRMLIYRAAVALASGGRCTKEASMAKLFCSDHAMKHATDAIQILGGNGYTKGYPVERYFRDAKVLQIYDGTSQIHRWIIARQLMKEM